MFSSSCNVIHPCSNYSFYCSICKQRFQTEKNFKRHNSSRKHIKQIQCNKGKYHRMEQMNERSAEFDLLPKDLFEFMVTDLASQVFEKNEFFNEIRLVEENDLDLTAALPERKSYSPKSLHSRMDCNPIVYRPNQPSIRKVPAIYPCLTCFQLLDSQKNFDAHMLESHFNGSFSAPN